MRNRGTIGGNVCVNDPTNHFPPLLVALDASFTIRGSGGERVVGAEEFFLGVYTTAVEEGELLTKVSVPTRKPGTGDAMTGLTLGAHGTYVVSAAATVGTRRRAGRARLRRGDAGSRDRDGGARSPAGTTPRRRCARRPRVSAPRSIRPSDVHASADYRRAPRRDLRGPRRPASRRASEELT